MLARALRAQAREGSDGLIASSTRSPHETLRRLAEIGERLHLDSGTLTPVLKRRQAAGYVQRYRDAEDERLLRVDLTSEGRSLRSRAVEVWRSITARLGKSEEQLGSLRQAIDQLRPALASAD